MRTFKMVVFTPAGEPEPSLAIAATKAGGIGILNIAYFTDIKASVAAIDQLATYSQGEFGLKLDGKDEEFLEKIVSYLSKNIPGGLKYIFLTPGSIKTLRGYIRTFHDLGLTVFWESTSLPQARLGKEIGVDGIVAKGHETGGKIGEETSFILLQKILTAINLPVLAYGGIGLHTAAACYAAGAGGVVLDSQVLLAKESPLSREVKSRLSNLDGTETICLGQGLNCIYRVFGRANLPMIKDLLQQEEEISHSNSADKLNLWRHKIRQHIGWRSLDNQIFPLGQDIYLASFLARRFVTVGGILQGIRQSIQKHIDSAAKVFPLDEGSPLALSHKTRYPIVQGPMARICEVPEFALEVAMKGSLPFIELAMMPADKAHSLLGKAEKILAGYSWGVGILGFIEATLLKEQIEAILAHKPSFVLIAGGRPDQVNLLEGQGITAYIHCPSPELLKIFLTKGLRRFIFEGMECGGHLGPRTSFTLWEKSVETILDFFSSQADPSSCQVLFAGGIHDALSSLMVSIIAAPLAEIGVKVGVQIGSAYLFTKEAVSKAALIKEFQRQLLMAKGTVRLETSPGYVTRCLPTPFTKLFAKEKQLMVAQGRSTNEIRDALEVLNLGRLRIAAKGIDRNPVDRVKGSKYISVPSDKQREQGIYMIGQMAALRKEVLTIDELHQQISQGATEAQKRLVETEKKSSLSIHQTEQVKAPEIAIIGMACILPRASDLYTYWENILNRVNAIEEVPPDRWDHQVYYHKNRKERDKIYSKWGGFIEEIPFDTMDYGMPPNSLHSIEPLHLITLQVVHEALRDAGYLERAFPRERTSVIIGAGGGVADLGIKYSIRSFLPLMDHITGGKIQAEHFISELDNFLPEWTEDSFPGILMNVAAGRVANRFDLTGSNFTVDAACASSMAAVYLAVKELQTYSSDMVVVGGSDTMQNPFTYLCFSKTQALSPTGKSCPLDESADGIVLGEGVGMVILKRLSDAERDGDRIYAVIKGVGSSSDGRDKCLTAPRPEGQVLALHRAYDQAGICPSTVGLIEAHGTGTVVGDRTEVQALSKVFTAAGAKQQSCAIGSVKSMIGHTKCTAGVAGLIKAAMALHSKILPPTIGVTQPNKKANLSETPFYVNADSRPWFNSLSRQSGGQVLKDSQLSDNRKGQSDSQDDGQVLKASPKDMQIGQNYSQVSKKRRAGVSAFGFGGTNFHVVLEEYQNLYSVEPLYRKWPAELLVWRAESREELKEQLSKLEKQLDDTCFLREVAYARWQEIKSSLRTGGSPISLSVVATGIEDLNKKLVRVKEALSSPGVLDLYDPTGVYLVESKARLGGKIAFLFPGQGSQYPNMVKDLALYFPEFLSSLERLDSILYPYLGMALTDYIFPIPVFSDEERINQHGALTKTRIAQPGIGAVSVALYHLLKIFDLSPDMVAGHSYGEYVALWAASVLTEENLMLLSEARGRIIEQAASGSPGAMAAINTSEKEVESLISGKEGVWIANYNSQYQTVISGNPLIVQGVADQGKDRGIKAQILPVSCAFHSPLVEAAKNDFAEFLNTVPMNNPRLPVYSNTTAEAHPEDAIMIGQKMVEHMIKPVRFKQQIEAMYEQGARIFVEVGPRSILTNLVNQILSDQPHLSVATDQGSRSSLIQLQHCLGQLAVHGVPVNLNRLYENRADQELSWSVKEERKKFSPSSPTTWLIRGDRIRKSDESLEVRDHKDPEDKLSDKVSDRAGDKAVDKVNQGMERPGEDKGLGFQRSSGVGVERIGESEGIVKSDHGEIETARVAYKTKGKGQGMRTEDRVIQQFQEMMSKFLNTQKEVMLQYLRTGGGSSVSNGPAGRKGSPCGRKPDTDSSKPRTGKGCRKQSQDQSRRGS